jgi:hypothetical protein
VNHPSRPQPQDALALCPRVQVLGPRRRRKFTAAFDAGFAGTGIIAIRTPPKAPQANAFAERWIRWIRTLRHELLDRNILWNERQLQALLVEYVEHYNEHRRHLGIGQRAPQRPRRRRPDRGRPSDPTSHHLRQTHQRVPTCSLTTSAGQPTPRAPASTRPHAGIRPIDSAATANDQPQTNSLGTFKLIRTSSWQMTNCLSLLRLRNKPVCATP